MAERYERYERYGYVNIKWEKLLAILLLVIMAAFTAGMFADKVFADFSTETVSSPSEAGIGTGGTGGAIIPAVVDTNETNESEAEICPGCPDWWYWSKEDWEKFQWYANETEITWTYNKTTGKKTRGKVMVAGEPLWSGQRQTAEFGNQWPVFRNPLEYFTVGERRGNCLIVPYVIWHLFKAKGKIAKFTSADNIDYNPEWRWMYNEQGEKKPVEHGWIEWIDNEGSHWVIDYNTVWPRDEWYQMYNWTVCWSQEEGPGLPPP